MSDSPYTDDEIRDNACELTHMMQEICVGRPTASVYTAIAYLMGSMEMMAPRPDREGLLRIISRGMDEYIAFTKRQKS